MGSTWLSDIFRSTSRSVKIPGHTILAVDDRDGSDVVVEHLVNGVRYAGFQTYRCNLPITKLQHAHTHLLGPVPFDRIDTGNRIDAL